MRVPASVDVFRRVLGMPVESVKNPHTTVLAIKPSRVSSEDETTLFVAWAVWELTHGKKLLCDGNSVGFACLVRNAIQSLNINSLHHRTMWDDEHQSSQVKSIIVFEGDGRNLELCAWPHEDVTVRDSSAANTEDGTNRAETLSVEESNLENCSLTDDLVQICTSKVAVVLRGDGWIHADLDSSDSFWAAGGKRSLRQVAGAVVERVSVLEDSILALTLKTRFTDEVVLWLNSTEWLIFEKHTFQTIARPEYGRASLTEQLPRLLIGQKVTDISWRTALRNHKTRVAISIGFGASRLVAEVDLRPIKPVKPEVGCIATQSSNSNKQLPILTIKFNDFVAALSNEGTFQFL